MEATSSTARTIALTAIAPVAWGSSYLVTRQLLPPDIPLLGAALRALPAGLLLLALGRRLPRGSWWWRTALISMLTIGGFFVLVYVAGQRLPSSVAATLMAASALVTLVAARVVLGERAPRRAWLGAVAGIGGVVLLVGASAGGLDPVGVGASLLAMLSATIGFVLTKKWQPPVPPLVFAGWQLTLGGLVLAPIALFVEGPPPAMSAGAVAGFAYLILVGTALAYVVWFLGLSRLPAGTVGMVGLLNPVSGAVLGLVVAGERLTLLQVVGGVVVLAGVAAGLPARRRTDAGEVSPSPTSTATRPAPDAPATAGAPRPASRAASPTAAPRAATAPPRRPSRHPVLRRRPSSRRRNAR
ncbi:DMT family transporter [Lapillicoccus jejuensis]|uniref:Putative blue pigment (Indigoidine) exporter n=1 Tax=Lapillicoccus jejuensis TaxID=402171 RepID=A0A542DYP9_9MICO|nr:DMT family transporter [Lapillicoccus jejuensis]TQJ08231.1 putative blue pigment (indigoidine) exporter [Lapillicoccus jejuensis]